MPAPEGLLVYLGVAAALWVVYLVRKLRRHGGRPRFGDANAYEGNLVIPAGGGPRGTPPHHHPHRGGYFEHGGAHASHVSGHAGHGTGHVGHGPVSGHR